MTTPLRHTPLLNGTLQNLFYPPLENEYQYFRKSTVPFPGDGPLPRAAWASDAAMLAYARYGATRMLGSELAANFERAGLTCELIGGKYQDGGTIDDWNERGTQAVFATCPDFAICAFRGTERDDPADAVSDADFFLAYEPDYRPASQDPRPALGHLSFIDHLFASPCLVHHGFQVALNQVWEQVHSLITTYRSQHPQKEICFTGHSLGAALALLAFGRFADPDISLFTFGCPRVGNAAFLDRVLTNFGRGIYRFVNYKDVVAHIPTESLIYRQTPDSCYRITEEGNLETDDSSFRGDVHSLQAAITGLPAALHLADLNTVPAPPSLVDHSPARYCFRLWDFVELPQ